MIRVLALLARRPDLSRAAFRAHYEQVHAPLGMSVLEDIPHYLRNHVVRTLAGPEPFFDVLSEFGYADARALGAMAKRLASSELGDPIRRDEESFMDKPRNVFFSLEPVATAGPWDATAAAGAKLAILAAAPEARPERGPFAAQHARELSEAAGGAGPRVTFRTRDAEHRAPFDAVSFLCVGPDDAVTAPLQGLSGDVLQLAVDACATRACSGWSGHG